VKLAAWLGLGALAALAVAPLVLEPYPLTLLLQFFAYGITLLGLNLLFGYTGLLSFGQALFVALGAYSAAVCTRKLGWHSFELILVVATVAAVAVAVPVGMLCVRYVSIFFGMLTLAFGMLFHSFLFKFYTVTGGDGGMLVERPTLLGMRFSGMDKTLFLTRPFYWYALCLLALGTVLMWRLVHSPLGLHLSAIRENARKAEYLGVEVRRLRLIAFVIAAVYAAVGGTLLGIRTGLADPELAYWTHSGNLIFMTVLGGFSSFAGPLVGAGVFIFLQDSLMSFTQYWRLVMGVVLVVIVVLFPRGLVGLAQAMVARLTGRRRDARAD
jgi:branched-chain amino acid transport system permease protein